MKPKRKLLIFAKAPAPGRVKTRLAATLGSAAACALYTGFLTDLCREVAAPFAGETTWWLDGDEKTLRAVIGEDARVRRQREGDLGDRLTVAFDHAFGQDSAPVAAIGADCPELDADRLDALFDALEAGADCALIPAADGGYAAIGLSLPCPEAFQGIAWSSDLTLADTLARLEDAGRRVTLLAPLDDVDDLYGLQRLISALQTVPSARLPATREALTRLGLLDDAPSVIDDLCRPVPLEPAAQRIVSLVPGVTEALFDLGAGNRVVGRTDYCISPAAEMARLSSVGGPKTVEVERLVALAPDLVFADAEENDREQIEALLEAGVRVFVALPRTLADGASWLRRAGRLVGAEAAARRYADEIDLLDVPPPPATRTGLCLIWKEPWMAATAETFVGAVMAAAGVDNVAPAGEARYPSLSTGQLAALSPRLLLLPSEPYPFDGGHARELASLLPQATPLPFPGEWVSWYGCRVAENVKKLRARLAPFA